MCIGAKRRPLNLDCGAILDLTCMANALYARKRVRTVKLSNDCGNSENWLISSSWVLILESYRSLVKVLERPDFRMLTGAF